MQVKLEVRSITTALRNLKVLLDAGDIVFVSENLETLAKRIEQMAAEQEGPSQSGHLK